MPTNPFQIVSQFQPFGRSDDVINAHSNSGVLVLCCNPVESHKVVCGSSEGDVALVDLNTALTVQSCCGHDRAITDASFVRSDPHLIVSASRDGTASLFDSRLASTDSRIAKIRLTLENDEADVWSVSTGGSSECVLACSHADQVLLYDMRVISTQRSQRNRHAGLICTLKDFHNDTISCVRFHPTRRELLVSGADDDFACLYDTNRCDDASEMAIKEDVEDEDSAFIGGINTESPPRLIQFVGPQLELLCIISTTETVQAWHCPGLSSSSNPESSSLCSFLPAAESNGDFSCHRLINPASDIRLAAQLTDGDSCGHVVNVIYSESTERLFALGGK